MIFDFRVHWDAPFLYERKYRTIFESMTPMTGHLPNCENTGDKISTCPPLAYRAWRTTGGDSMEFENQLIEETKAVDLIVLFEVTSKWRVDLATLLSGTFKVAVLQVSCFVSN